MRNGCGEPEERDSTFPGFSLVCLFGAGRREETISYWRGLVPEIAALWTICSLFGTAESLRL